MDKRGQISTYDIVVALFIFVLVFATMRGIWISNVQKAETEQEYNIMKLKAMQAIESMVKTKGYPKNWDGSNVELLGLARKQNVLSESKVMQFAAMDYSTAKDLLLIANYDFNFSLHSAEPTDSVSVGMPLDSNSTVISIKRVVKYKGAEADVVFKVFKE